MIRNGCISLKRCVLSAALVLFCFVAAARGQSTGAIVGTLIDPSGAVIPGVSVSIVNEGTGAVRTVATNESGNYVAESLPVGTYTVSVEQAGFKPVIRKGIVLNVAERLTVDMTLELGTKAEAITVTAEAVQVQRGTGEVSYLVTGQQITELDLNGRNFISLVGLSPGVVGGTGILDEPKQGWDWKGLYVNGLRTQYNNWSIDGAFNVDPGSEGAILNNYPSVEAIAEFKALTSNYNAEYGNSGSMNNLIVLRSGTRNFHGSVYEFLRNDKLDAANFFAPYDPVTHEKLKDPLKENDFGYSIGGPVFIPGVYNTKKDKTFFFWSQEWRRRRQGQSLMLRTVPTPFRSGDFTSLGYPLYNDPLGQSPTPLVDHSGNPCIQNNIISSDCINPVATAYFQQLWPSPTPGYENDFYNYRSQYTVPYNFRQELIRVDHNFSDKVRLMVHYIQDSVFEHYPNDLWWGGNLPTITSSADTPGQNAMIKLTTILSPTLLNEVNYNLSASYPKINIYGNYAKGGALQIGEIWPANSLNRVPDVYLGSYGYIGVAQYPWNDHQKAHTVGDILSKVVRNHSLKMGAQYQYGLKNQDSGAQTNGAFYPWGELTRAADWSAPGDPVADLLLNNGDWYYEAEFNRRGFYRYHQFEAFAQDDWKVNSHLSLNLGVRFYYIPHAYEKDNQISNWYPARYNPADAGNPMNGIVVAGQGVPRGLVNNYGGHTWGPRFGFAYDPTGGGKTVIRGGFGMGFARVEGNDIYGVINNPPFSASDNMWLPPFDHPENGISSGAGTPSLLVYDPQYKIPTAYSYSFGVQHELVQDTLLSVAYVGTRGIHLERSRDFNQPLPVTGFDFDPGLVSGGNINNVRPYQGFGSITWQETTARSWYDSLQVNFQKRFSRGLSFQAAYTWSKTLESASRRDDLPQNSYNMTPEKGLASFDIPQMLTFNYIYELPFFKKGEPVVKAFFGNWQISGITTFQSGGTATPGLVRRGNDLATRPNLIGNVNAGPKTPEQWFNVAALAYPTPGFFGNAGRGSIRLPGLNQWNFALMKMFPIHEDVKLQFRFESFNLFNHTNFGPGPAFASFINTSVGSSGIGQLSGAHDPRILQFGLKLMF